MLMKILVVSDVHRNRQRLAAIMAEHCDASLNISLGDSELKSSVLAEKKLIAVRGNYPFDAGIADDHVIEVEGRRWFLTHGHKYGVRAHLDALYEQMCVEACDIALYGHTHRAAWTKQAGRLMLNPGSVHQSRDDKPESYLLLSAGKTEIVCNWHDARTHALIEKIHHRF